MDLRIMDTSNYIYAGDFMHKYVQRGVRESDGMYEANSASIGGVRFLIRQAHKLLDDNTHVIPVFDTTPTIKREMYDNTFHNINGYKGTRTYANPTIRIQRDYAYEVMRDIGFMVQRVEGYEADDVIYTLVNALKDDYEHIYIHTRDSDLAFLVSDNVTIETVGDKGKHIDRYNYPYSLKKDWTINYNFYMLHKLCEGDKADNIPGIGKEWLAHLDEVVNDNNVVELGDLDKCRVHLREVIKRYPSEKNADRILQTFNILCPLLVNTDELEFYDDEINYGKLNYYLHDWAASEDKWNLEDMLLTYIEDCHR